MDPQTLLRLLLHGNQLKRTPRSGWLQRGVPAAEDVAAHSYGVAFIALALAEAMEGEVNVERVLKMALLHDLPEGVTTDIPAPAWRYLPPGAKASAEARVIGEIVADVSWGEAWLNLWNELQAGESLEAMLVHDADKLDMYLQAWIYERSSGNLRLQEFWERARPLALPASQALFDAIKARRDAERRS